MPSRWLVLTGLLVGETTTASAQLAMLGVRDLKFGAVMAGVAKHVFPSDALNSGEYDVTASLNGHLQLKFTLPSQLNGPAGATMPISFANSDGIILETGPGSVPVTFNPKGTTVYRLSNGNRMLIFLGGTVSPVTNQRIGSYTAPVTLTLTIVG